MSDKNNANGIVWFVILASCWVSELFTSRWESDGWRSRYTEKSINRCIEDSDSNAILSFPLKDYTGEQLQVLKNKAQEMVTERHRLLSEKGFVIFDWGRFILGIIFGLIAVTCLHLFYTKDSGNGEFFLMFSLTVAISVWFLYGALSRREQERLKNNAVLICTMFGVKNELPKNE